MVTSATCSNEYCWQSDGFAPTYICNIPSADAYTCKIPHEVLTYCQISTNLNQFVSTIYMSVIAAGYSIRVARILLIKLAASLFKQTNSDIDFLINYYEKRSKSHSLLTNVGSFQLSQRMSKVN